MPIPAARKRSEIERASKLCRDRIGERVLEPDVLETLLTVPLAGHVGPEPPLQFGQGFTEGFE